jgi:hypothetical protein
MIYTHVLSIGRQVVRLRFGQPCGAAKRAPVKFRSQPEAVSVSARGAGPRGLVAGHGASATPLDKVLIRSRVPRSGNAEPDAQVASE